jgi:hypothetical protein
LVYGLSSYCSLITFVRYASLHLLSGYEQSAEVSGATNILVICDYKLYGSEEQRRVTF